MAHGPPGPPGDPPLGEREKILIIIILQKYTKIYNQTYIQGYAPGGGAL